MKNYFEHSAKIEDHVLKLRNIIKRKDSIELELQVLASRDRRTWHGTPNQVHYNPWSILEAPEKKVLYLSLDNFRKSKPYLVQR